MFRVRLLSCRGVNASIFRKDFSIKSIRRLSAPTNFQIISDRSSILNGNCNITKPRRGVEGWWCGGMRRVNTGKYPEHTKVTLPALSPTMEKGRLVRWSKKQGDELKEGDLLAEIETDKATMGFETPEEGFLARIIIPDNTSEIPLGKLLCIIVTREEDIAAFQAYTPTDDSLRGDAYPPPTIEVNTPTPSQIRAMKYPEHTKVTLPALSPTMEKGRLVRWSKKQGDELKEGDLLAEIETDKATMGFETPEEGFLARIIIPDNTSEIPLGKLLCIIVTREEDIAAFEAYTPTEDSLRADAYPADIIIEAAKVYKQPPPEPSSLSNKDKLPEHIKVTLPSLSPTMEKGNLQAWMVGEGEQLKEGDVLAQIETDKATMDFETPEEGFLARIMVPSGTQALPVGAPLCIIVTNKEDVAAFKNYSASDATPPPPSPPPTPPPTTHSVPTSSPTFTPTPILKPTLDNSKTPASPLAKRLATERGIDISLVRGTGPGSRVTAGDVQSFKSPPPVSHTPPPPSPSYPPPPSTSTSYTDIPLSSMRQVIAKRLLLSKQTIPHYYLTVNVIMNQVISLRKELNEHLSKEGVKLSVNDFVIKASALSCKKIPEANSSWQESFIRQHNNVDINVAVATPYGLITPIVFSADKKGLATIATDVLSLAGKAKEGKLQPHEFQGGTFTISNLGMYGISSFSAIINPPQACILAVGGAQQTLLPDHHSDNHRSCSLMSVTLSCDHRVVDGAVGAEWLSHFRKVLEAPHMMLL